MTNRKSRLLTLNEREKSLLSPGHSAPPSHCTVPPNSPSVPPSQMNACMWPVFNAHGNYEWRGTVLSELSSVLTRSSLQHFFHEDSVFTLRLLIAFILLVWLLCEPYREEMLALVTATNLLHLRGTRMLFAWEKDRCILRRGMIGTRPFADTKVNKWAINVQLSSRSSVKLLWQIVCWDVNFSAAQFAPKRFYPLQQKTEHHRMQLVANQRESSDVTFIPALLFSVIA